MMMLVMMMITLVRANKDGSSVRWKADSGSETAAGADCDRSGSPLAVDPGTTFSGLIWFWALIWFCILFLKMIWAADQAPSDGGFILAGELVCSVDCPTLPLAPIPDLNQMMFVTTKNHNGSQCQKKLIYMKSSKTAMLKGCLRVLVENRMMRA